MKKINLNSETITVLAKTIMRGQIDISGTSTQENAAKLAEDVGHEGTKKEEKRIYKFIMIVLTLTLLFSINTKLLTN